MSYEKIKSVKMNGNDIIIKSVSNNVSPKKYEQYVFKGSLQDFIRYICGDIFQIYPSANNYYWYFVNQTFLYFIKLSYPRLTKTAIYNLRKNDRRWPHIIEHYKSALLLADSVKRTKYVLKNKDNDYYVTGHAFGNKYYLSTDKNEAMKVNPWKTKYFTEVYHFNRELFKIN